MRKQGFSKELEMEERNHNAAMYARSFLKNQGSIVIFLILFILALIFVPNFASVSNFSLVIKQAAIPIIACLGMTTVLMTGGIDLSLGYLIGLSSIIVGLLVKTFDVPAFAAVILTLGVGALFGLLNGVIVQVVRVPAFITTLGTGYIAYGLAQIVSQGEDISRLPKAFRAIGNTDFLGTLTTSVLIAAIICLVMYYVLHRSTFGRQLSAFGFNSAAASVSGIKTGKINILVYVICSTLTALAGILLTIRVNCAQPNMGGGTYTFEIVTAAIVGGTSLFGGVGTVVGSVFGVLITKVIENCINLLGIQYYMYQATQGVVILLAIIFEKVKNKNL